MAATVQNVGEAGTSMPIYRIDRLLRLSRWDWAALGLLAAACAAPRPYPDGYAACYERMQRHAAELLPAFHALGYRPEVRLQLDEEMRNGRGFRQPDDLLGDSVPWGRIRLRPARLCDDDAAARAVLAHEIAHVALRHQGVPDTGLVLAWERPPQQEAEADALALAAIRRAGGHPSSARYLECRLQDCGSSFSGLPLYPSYRERPAAGRP